MVKDDDSWLIGVTIIIIVTLALIVSTIGCMTVPEEYEEVYTARYYWSQTIDEIIDINWELTKEKYNNNKQKGE